MKYQSGDIVIVKKNLDLNKQYGKAGWYPENWMLNLKYGKVEIKCLHHCNTCYTTEFGNYLTDEMIEGIANKNIIIYKLNLEENGNNI